MKRITGILLSAALMLGVFLTPAFAADHSKLSANKTREMFDEFLKQDFIDYVTSDSFTLHMTLRNPEKYGITGYEISWGNSLNWVEDARKAIKEFRTFDRAKLTVDQRKSYDIYAYRADLFETGLDLYYFDTAFQDGLHLGLPFMLSEYYFSRPQDIDDYLTLCSQVGMLFDDQIIFERHKSEIGMFMSDRMVDDVIEECNNFLLKTNSNILITSFEKRLNAVNFVNKAKKQEYINQNKRIFNNTIVPAYKRVITELEKLKGTGKNDKGLAHFKKGKDYYRYELKKMGISRTPEELINIYDKKLAAIPGQMKAASINSIVVSGMGRVDFNRALAPNLSPENLMELLRKRTAEDFPSLPRDITYTIKYADSSLTDYVTGVYMTPQLDYYKNNIIYYDKDHRKGDRDWLFELMAHEGFPGHLLQTVYFYSSDLPEYRKIRSFRAYSEGWGQYAENYSFKYTDADESIIKLYQLNNEADMAIFARVDLGVNYEGWTLGQMTNYLKKITWFDGVSVEYFKELYYHTVRNAMSIIPYAVGQYEIELLRYRYQVRLGSAYSDKLFHEEFLKCGEAPFHLVRKWMDEVFPDSSKVKTAA